MTKLVFMLMLCSIINCGITVDRWTTYSYYIDNNSDSVVKIIGVSYDSSSSETDTIIDTVINPDNQLHIYSGYDGFEGGVTDYTLKFESCDSLFILKGSVYLNRSVNFLKHSELSNVDSSSTIFYQFYNPTIWVPYDTTEYEGKGPQPKEIFFKFTIDKFLVN